MVKIVKPFFLLSEIRRKCKNIQGELCTVKYYNTKGAKVILKDGTEVFVPFDALKKVRLSSDFFIICFHMLSANRTSSYFHHI